MSDVSHVKVRIEAQMHGGRHGAVCARVREATHQIVGMGEAFRITKEEMAEDNARILKLKTNCGDSFPDMEEVYLNGDANQRFAWYSQCEF